MTRIDKLHIWTQEPGFGHPVLWVIVEIFGIRRSDVCRLAGISTVTFDRLRDGAPCTRKVDERLRQLVANIREELARRAKYSSDLMRTDDVFRHHRENVYKLIDRIVQDNVQIHKTQTELSTALLGLLPNSRRYIIAQLAQQYARQSIDRCAHRLEVREVRRPNNNELWWYPPASLEGKPIEQSKPKYIAPRGERQAKLQDALLRLLEKAPRYSMLAADVIYALRPYTKSEVYRAAKNVAVLRTTEGFGPTKRTTWTHPTMTENG
jgi:hypothetical protein